MNLPHSAKIVIIDDNYNEVSNLCCALAKYGCANIYWDGTKKNLPKNIAGVRFLFLDIELKDSKGLDSKSKASLLASKIKLLLGLKPGPYFIVFWTGHAEAIEHVISYLGSEELSPIAYVDLEKPSKLNTNKETITSLTQRINEKLSEIGAFSFFIFWENFVNSKLSNFINEITSIVIERDGKVWSENIFSLLGYLAKMETGQKELPSDYKTSFFHAFSALKKSFADDLIPELKEIDLLANPNINSNTFKPDIGTVGKINSKLHIDKSSIGVQNGSLYIDKNNRLLRENLERDIFTDPFRSEEIAQIDVQLCFTVITPPCDLVQKKVIKNHSTNKESQRVLYGLKIKWNKTCKELNKKINQVGKEARFLVGPFTFDNDRCYFIFHFGTISTLWNMKKNKKNQIFRFKREVVADLQTKFASHSSRLGNSVADF